MWFSSRSWRRTTQEVPAGPVRDFLVTPKPPPQTLLTRAPLLAVDVETTGLDANRDQILSIGWVPVDGLDVRLSGAGQVLVRPSVGVGDSASIHGLTDDALADALSPSDALDALFTALRGRVLLAHHAAIETGFVGRVSNGLHGFRPRFSVVDTMTLQFRLLSQGFDDEPPQGSLRLWNARSQYGLPRYAAHNALTDALACAELYLAQVAELQSLSAKPLTLKSVLKY
jgi:DNA polymerase III subunit epsilon